MEVENKQTEDSYEIKLPFHPIQSLSSEDLDVQSLCRICLSTDKTQLFPLISAKDMLQEMFTSLTCIQLQPDYSFPSHVCEECRSQVIFCFEFRERCIRADHMLRSLLSACIDSKEQCVLEKKEEKTIVPDKVNSEGSDSYHEEIEAVEDVQYLEDISESDDENLCIVKDADTRKQPEQVTASISATQTSPKKPKYNACSFCKKRFHNSKAVKSHVKRCHSTSKHPHACSECHESFQSDNDLLLHKPVHGPGPMWSCVKCDKEFKGRSMFRRHVKRHMECKQYSCSWCGKAFAERYALRRHTRVHTGERVDKKHACTLCDKRYSSKGLLAAHARAHAGSRPCVCARCGATFPSARLLASHRRVHSDLKPHACQYCDRRFRHESTRNTHHRTHTGERPYVCAVCGKRFIQNSNLTLHMRTHTGEKPYTCTTCNTSFSSSSTLRNHTRRHTGDKPYSCDICGKKFARSDLRAHRRQHTGERPFACAVCARRFGTAARLRDHSRLHTGEKAFKCANCSQSFTTKPRLAKHLKSSHQKKKNTNTQQVYYFRDTDPEAPSSGKSVEQGDKWNVEDIAIMDVADPETKEVVVEATPDDVSGEIILSEEVTDTHNLQTGTLCLSSGVSADMNYAADNLVAINAIEGTTVKLYQLDQSLVQIHSSGGQVTISKITSKMTANF